MTRHNPYGLFTLARMPGKEGPYEHTTLEGGACQKPFDEHVELFLRHLRAAGLWLPDQLKIHHAARLNSLRNPSLQTP